EAVLSKNVRSDANTGSRFSRWSHQRFLNLWALGKGGGEDRRWSCHCNGRRGTGRLGSLHRDDLLSALKSSNQGHHLFHIDHSQLITHRQHELPFPEQDGLGEVCIRSGFLPGDRGEVWKFRHRLANQRIATA